MPATLFSQDLVEGTASIYALVHPLTGEMRYIGKANSCEKRLKSHLRDSRRRNTPVYSWIRKLASQGQSPEMIVLAEGCADWKAKERSLIASARAAGYRLLNLADGGDEPLCSREVRVSNAKKLNESWVSASDASGDDLRGYLNMMRRAGQAIRYFQSIGRVEKAAKLEDAVSRLRALPKEKKIRAGQQWLECRGYRND